MISLGSTIAPHPAITFIDAILAPSDIAEVRLIDRRGRHAPRSRWKTAADVSLLLPELSEMNADGWDVFIGANPRTAIGKRGDENVPLARNLFVDFDGDILLGKAVERLMDFGLPMPGITVFSGHGWHFWWRLSEPITDLAAFTTIQADMAAALGSDGKVINPERIMRMPGFDNNKEADAIIRANLWECNTAAVFELADIVDRIPPRDDAAVAADTFEAKADAVAQQIKAPPARQEGIASVIEAFNDAHDIGRLLRSLGFTSLHKPGHFSRPGKTDGGTSVIVRDHPKQRSFHFSSNDAFNKGRFGHGTVDVHDCFDLYCLAHHDGDQKAAIRAAARELGLSHVPAVSAPKPQTAGTSESRAAVNGPPVEVADFAPFPVDQLPPVLSTFVVEAAQALQADPAFIVSPLLAALGAAIGNAAVVLLKKGFAQPPLLWTSVVATSGAAKTPTQNAALAPVRKRQTAMVEEYQKQLAEFAEAKSKYDAIKPKDRTEDDKPPQQPVLQHAFVQDVTCEALAVRLQQNPRGVLSAQDELAAHFKSFNTYKQGGRDKETWLSMYDAGYAKVDRKTSDIKTLIVPRAFVALTGGIQPGILGDVLNASDFDSGLAARFLFCMPPTQRREWNDDEIDDATEQALASVYARLYALPLAYDGSEPKPTVLPLTADARRLWATWYGEIEDEKQTGSNGIDETPYHVALPKLQSTAARLALIFQLVSFVSEPNVFATCIDTTSMARGIAVARWFKAEQARVYSRLSVSREHRQLLALEAGVRQHGIDGGITIRDWQNKRRIKTSEAAETDLHRLVTAGRAVWVWPPQAKSGGRPSKTLVLRDKTPTGNAENGGMVGRTISEVEVEPSSGRDDYPKPPALDTPLPTRGIDHTAPYATTAGGFVAQQGGAND